MEIRIIQGINSLRRTLENETQCIMVNTNSAMQCFECANVRDAKERNNTQGLSYLLYEVGRGRCLVIYLKLSINRLD